MSLEPTLQGVPSSAASPHGTITLSSVSVQYSSQGSAERFKRLECLDIFYHISHGISTSWFVTGWKYLAYFDRSRAARCSSSPCTPFHYSRCTERFWNSVRPRGKVRYCRFCSGVSYRYRIFHQKQARDDRTFSPRQTPQPRSFWNTRSTGPTHPIHRRLVLVCPILGRILDFGTTSGKILGVQISFRTLSFRVIKVI